MKLALFAFCLATWLSGVSSAKDVMIPPGRSDEQARQANVILYFDGFERISMERPEAKVDYFPLIAVADSILSVTRPRQMVVVIMSKRTRIWPDIQFKGAVDDLEARLQKLGFKKVIFHLASGTYPTPIYREWPAPKSPNP